MELSSKTLSIVHLDVITVGNRYREDFGDLEALAADISANGLISPIAVMKNLQEEAEQVTYTLLAGERRYRAHQMLAMVDNNFSSIACNIYPYIENEFDRRTIELAENLQREAMSFQEECALKLEIHRLQVSIHGVKERSSKTGHSMRDTARMLGESPTNLSRDLELAEAMEQLPELKKAKNKNEAAKAYSRVKEDMLRTEMAKRAETRRANTSEDKARKKLTDSYMLIDTFKGLEQLADSTIDFFEIDPPYNIELRHVVNTSKREDKELMGGDKPLTKEEYGTFIKKLLREVMRVLRPNGWVIMWHATEPWHQPMLNWMKAAGLEMTGVPCMWVKNVGNTRTPNIHFKNLYEPFFYARKGNAMLAKPGMNNVFDMRAIAGSNKVHPNEKPIELYMKILQAMCLPHHFVCSAFAGSGNCLLATSNLGMQAIGFDINENHRNGYVVKVHGGTPGEYTSF